MYFKKVRSFDDLKSQFRALIKANHPDNGGSEEAMKEINIEYDALFLVWKERHEKETGRKVDESAGSTRTEFYSQNGWVGSNYNSRLGTKEICKIIRLYVKEKYPTYKFSVRCSFASMCSEIHVEMKESPLPVYKTYDELSGREALKPFGYHEDFNQSEVCEVWKQARKWYLDKEYNCYDEELDSVLREVYEKYRSLWIREEIAQAIVDDVNAFVDSYRYEDIDSMTDYFDVSDYYFGCKTDGVKIVPKTARIAKPKEEVKTTGEKTKSDSDSPQGSTEAFELGDSGYTVEKTQHTKTGAEIYVVRFTRRLSKEEYAVEADRMKKEGGYYSRYVHGFVFRENPEGKIA